MRKHLYLLSLLLLCSSLLAFGQTSSSTPSTVPGQANVATPGTPATVDQKTTSPSDASANSTGIGFEGESARYARPNDSDKKQGVSTPDLKQNAPSSKSDTGGKDSSSDKAVPHPEID